MHTFCKKIFALFLAFSCFFDCCFAGFPPVEVIAHLKEYKISSAELKCNMPQDDTGLRDEIKKVYFNLYSNESTIGSLDLSYIRENYPKFVRLNFEPEYGIISLLFDYEKFIDTFLFDTELAKKAFKKDGSIPLVIEYSVSCTMKSLTSSDEVVHKIVFDSFYGGNLILKEENSSKVFMHVQDKLRGNPGQMILTDQKEEARNMVATF